MACGNENERNIIIKIPIIKFIIKMFLINVLNVAFICTLYILPTFTTITIVICTCKNAWNIFYKNIIYFITFNIDVYLYLFSFELFIIKINYRLYVDRLINYWFFYSLN